MEDKAFREEQSRRVREGLAASDKKGGRPYKPLNVEKALEWLNRGDPQTTVAHDQGMSVTTLKKRMKEAGIVKEAKVYVLKEEEKSG